VLTTTTKKGITTPNENDILSGRGAGVNLHPGNLRYRKLIQSYKLQYVKSDPVKKKQIIKFVFNTAKQYGRFLKLDPITDDWTTVSDEEARMKVGQALRENAPKIKNQNDQKVLKQGGGEWLKFQEVAQSNPFSDEEYPIPRPMFNVNSPLDSLTSTQMKSDSTSLNQTGSHAPIIHLWSEINALQDKYDDLKQKQRQLEYYQNELMRDLNQMIKEACFLEGQSSNERWGPDYGVNNNSCFTQFPNKRRRIFE